MLTPFRTGWVGGVVLTLVGLFIMAQGCGSGSGALALTFCSASEFTPNYVGDVQLDQWTHMPIKVYFTNDATYTDASGTVDLKSYAQAGFDEWVTAANGLVSYQITSTAANADVTVTFTTISSPPGTGAELGLTQIQYASNKAMVSAAIQLFIWDGMSHDRVYSGFQATAAHEFGHALGIQGHSPNPGDLMYASHDENSPAAVTQSDLNTIKTDYACAQSGKADALTPRRIVATRTVVIP